MRRFNINILSKAWLLIFRVRNIYNLQRQIKKKMAVRIIFFFDFGILNGEIKNKNKHLLL